MGYAVRTGVINTWTGTWPPVGPFVERSSLPAQDAEALPTLPLEIKHVLMFKSSQKPILCVRLCVHVLVFMYVQESPPSNQRRHITLSQFALLPCMMIHICITSVHPLTHRKYHNEHVQCTLLFIRLTVTSLSVISIFPYIFYL